MDFFTEMFIELSSTFHTTFVQNGEFDWLSAYMLRTLASSKVTCVFYSGQIRTLVAMATYSSHRLIMGKRGTLVAMAIG